MPFESSKLIVVLSQRERKLFFSEEAGIALRHIIPESDWIDPQHKSFDWPKALKENEPDIVFGGWHLPEIEPTLLGECPSLKALCFIGGSVRHKIPREFLERGGIVTNWGNVISHSVAECALTLILCCLRQVPRFCHEMHELKDWRPDGPDLGTRGLFDRRVGLHGFGNVARELIRLLEPFNVRIEAWSEPVPDSVITDAGVVPAKDLQSLFADNEILIELEAFTPATRHSVRAEHLDRLKPGAVFINVGRGPVVDETALCTRLEKGDIQAGLDVFEKEPLPADSPLRGNYRVTLFPHSAGPTPDRYPICADNAVENLEHLLAGKPPLNPVTLDAYDRST